MTITQQLRQWADALDSGRIQQVYGDTFSDGSDGGPRQACILNSVNLALGDDASLGATLRAHGMMMGAVAAETERVIWGHDVTRAKSLARLNDDYRVSFPVFATAIRNIAYRLEEQESGEPIVRERAVERELVPA